MNQPDGTPEIVSPWKKGSLSNTLQITNCVETARLSDGGLAIRNSRHPEKAPHYFTHDEIGVFFQAVRDGEFGEFPLP